MKRNLSKAIEEFDKKYKGNTKEDPFFVSDLDQVMELSRFKETHDVYSIMSVALKAGYMIGWRSAKRA